MMCFGRLLSDSSEAHTKAEAGAHGREHSVLGTSSNTATCRSFLWVILALIPLSHFGVNFFVLQIYQYSLWKMLGHEAGGGSALLSTPPLPQGISSKF